MSSPDQMSRSSMATLPGSRRTAVTGARRRADVNSAEHATISIRLRRRRDAPDRLVGGMSREAFADRYGADPSDIAAVEAFARQAGLSVADSSIARRTVQVSGTLGELSAAFNVTLGLYDGPDGSYRGREGDIHVPEALATIVEGVFGFDNRRLARPHIAMEKYIQGAAGPVQSTPPTIPGSLTPHEVAGLYGFPSNDAAGQTIGILEFGGGFAPSDVTGYFTGYDLAVPSVTAVGVDGVTNSPGGDDYTVETALDIACAGSAAPGADLVVYFAPWSEQGWVDVVTTAVHDTTNRISTLTISYGWPEDGTVAGLTWSAAAIDAVSQTFAEAAALGVSVFVSSGDHGASCGVNSFACVEYPGSDQWVTSCGGTTISAVASGGFNETTWNEGGGWATGGGVSAIFPPQSYQDWSSVPSSLHDGRAGRGVPDVAGNAAQSSGYPLYVNGNWTGAVGGTSAVAPLYAGLAAVLNAAVGEPVGFLNPLLYANARTGVFRDIISGDNTIDAVAGYSAGTGWDACTGLGSIEGGPLLQAIRGVGRPPGLRELNGELYLLWKGFERDETMWIATQTGSAWSSQTWVDGMWSSVGPALAPYNGSLYAAWKGMETDQALWFRSFDGTDWTPQAVIPGTFSSNGPQLEPFNGLLYAAWKGAFDDQAIWYTSFDGTSWAAQQTIPNVASSVGPCLAAYNGLLYAAWKGMDDDEALYFSSFDGTSWAPQQLIPGWSTSGPALRSYGGNLVAAWKGMDGDEGLWFSTFDGTSWAPQQQIPGVASSVGPALETHGNQLWACWKGEFGDQSIWFSTFDGNTWQPQQQITTIGGTSPDL